MTSTRPTNVLFLCTGNSARSILSEALCNDLGKGRFIGWSAGSHPSAMPHADGIAELQRRGHRTDLYRSKSWNEFSADGPLADIPMDIVVTVCDNAAGEVCPVFFGGGVRVHWPAPDPAYVEPAPARQQAFSDVYDLCHARISALVALPFEGLSDRAALQAIADITP